jgi:hypothetical protein
MGRPGSKPAGFGHKAGLLWTRYGSTATMLTAGTRVPHTSPSATEVRSSVHAECPVTGISAHYDASDLGGPF